MTSDAVVIGAGVIGSAVALELARRLGSVTVVDSRGGPGYGSTSASSAMVRYHYHHFPECALAWEAGARWQQWERYLGVNDPAGMATFIKSGGLVLEGPGYDLTRMVSHLRTLGCPVDELDGIELAQRFPSLDPGKYGPPTLPSDDRFWADATGALRAFWVESAGHMDDPQLCAHNLAHAAETAGAQFLYRREVTDVVTMDGRVCGVRLADGTQIDAPIVVNVAGPWSAKINEMAGALGDFNPRTQPMEQEVISVPAPPGFRLDDGGTCVTDPDFATYFRVHAGNTIIVGAMEPDCDELVMLDSPEDAIASVRQSTWETQTLRLARRVRDLGIPSKPSGIIGVYDLTDDWIPIYDKTSLGGYYVAIGTSGHGFKQAPFVGELMAELITAVENGHDHDHEPLAVTGSWTGVTVDLGHFSRLRSVTPQRAMG
jgi:sarcosine oxidase subunit beta